MQVIESFKDQVAVTVFYVNREIIYRCNSRKIALGMFIAAFRILFFSGDKLIVVIKYIVLLFRRQLPCLHQQ
ncbi:MAG: hypothetical protein PHN83_05965, partial [Dysgonamonadaceae bacterium]|nr:hypothetical protein [Dysgonamonadaceae bacterium]